MANLVITNTFTNNTTADASQVNTNYTDISTWLNNRDNATDYWLNMKVSATAANPVDIVSTASTTEVSINNTATDGDPILTFKLSGSQTHVIGVDDSDSDFLKFATTSITTNVAMQIPTTGVQIQCPSGSAATPSHSFIGQTNTGMYQSGGSLRFSANGTLGLQFTDTAGTISLRAGSDGSASAPTWTFNSNTGAGMWSSSGSCGFSANGTQGGVFKDTGGIVSLVLGSGAIATNANYGFLYIVSCAGVPTGTPGSESGRIPLIYDSTNNKLYIYNSGWKGVTLS